MQNIFHTQSLRKNHRVYLTFLIGLYSILFSHAGTIISEGRASGDYRTAREQALADAMREAVRVGIGVDLLGESKVENFTMDYDRILCSAFGHIKNYTILESKLGSDGIYRVKIQAEVEKGAPEVKDTLALKQLIQAKGAPRLAFRVKSSSRESDNSFAASVLEEIADELQIPIVRVDSQHTGFTVADYVVEGVMDSQLERIETLGANPTQRVFSITFELKALDPSTSAVIAVGVFGADRVHKSSLPSENAAMRDVVKSLITDPNEGLRFFEKLLAHWVTETDLGGVKRLRFEGISVEDYERIHVALADTDKVGAVWPREFNANGTSVIDVETRLDNSALGYEVKRSSKTPLSIQKVGHSVISFMSSAQLLP